MRRRRTSGRSPSPRRHRGAASAGNCCAPSFELAGTNGLRRLRLCTLPPMKAAQHLYETAGFTRTPDLDWEPAPGVALRAYELRRHRAGAFACRCA